jgi:hypothetical protein
VLATNAVIQRNTRLPVIVNNDANLMAVGELYTGGAEASANQVFVKVGSGIGCGIISRGELFTGSNGWAGDISHVSVPGGGAVPCSCGRTGCLDAMASGNALVREMQVAGHDVDSVEAMIALARDSHPLATRLIRNAAVMTGGVLATIVNFFNPDRLVLGGVLADSSVFVAGVRSMLFADLLPMATEQLSVDVTSDQRTGGLHGAARMFLCSRGWVAAVVAHSPPGCRLQRTKTTINVQSGSCRKTTSCISIERPAPTRTPVRWTRPELGLCARNREGVEGSGMATKQDLSFWTIDALQALGGSAHHVRVAEHLWSNHEDELRSSGDLL